jgi:pyruvate formate lyase activating enzyme
LKVIDGKVLWDDKLCVNCDTCLKTCKFNASPKISYMSVEDILKRIHKAKPYIRGITCSGGECTLNKEFMYELFVETKKLGLTCLIDSNGSLDFEKYPELLDISDGVMLDVKAVDKTYHDKLVSFNNEIILKNLDYLLDKNKLYEVRTVIAPNLDNEKTVKEVGEIIKNKCKYKFNAYRKYGVRKEGLDFHGEEGPSEEELNHLKKYLK